MNSSTIKSSPASVHRRIVPLMLGAIFLWLGAPACSHSAACRERIDNCLRACPPAEPTAVTPGNRELGMEPIKQRPLCEQRCEGVCGPTPDGSRQIIEPAAAPLAPPP